MSFLSLTPYTKVGATLKRSVVTSSGTYGVGTKVTQSIYDNFKNTVIQLKVIDTPSVTRNFKKNKNQTYNTNGKSAFIFYSTGDAGYSFKVKCLIRKSDVLKDGKTVFYYLNQYYTNHLTVSVVIDTEVIPNDMYVISDFTEYDVIRKDYYEAEIEFTKYTEITPKLTNKCTVLQSHLKQCKKPSSKVYTTKQIKANKKGKPITVTVKKKYKNGTTVTTNKKIIPKGSTCIKYVNQMLYKKGYLSKSNYKNYGSFWTPASKKALIKFQKKWNKKKLKPKVNTKGSISKNCWTAIKRYPEV